jgi:NAD+ kinase
VRQRVGRAGARRARRHAADRDRGPRVLNERPPRRIALALHPRRDVGAARAIVERWASDNGVDLVDDDPDIVLSLGGDGTMLGALRRSNGVPVLAANLGRLGYLTEVDEAGLPAALEALAAGRFAIEERVALEASWDGGTRVGYNDVVLSRTPGQGRAALALHVDGQLLVRYASSGVIIATPMGSTAYSFAAGGPIISPQTRAMVVTPDAPHGLFNRAVVLGDDERVGVEVLASSGQVVLEVDGQLVATVEPGWMMEVTPHSRPARIVRLGDAGFAERARRKLGITDPAAIADPDML